MESIATKKNETEASLKASNPFDALYDGDSGDDVINSAVEKLKQASVGSKPDDAKKGKNSKNAKEVDNNSEEKANNKNAKDGNSNYSEDQYRANGQRGYGQRGVSHSHGYNNGHQNGYYNGHQNGYYNAHQNGLYRGNSGKISSSRSSNGTEDGASERAEKSSVKSEREQREEEFQQKLKEFKYDPKEEEENRKIIATYRETLEAKEAAIEKAKALLKHGEDQGVKGETLEKLKTAVKKATEDKNQHLEKNAEAWEYIRLSDKKKMTLAEYEKMKEEHKKASQVSKAEKRVVQSSEFDGMVVVAKKNLEDSLSLKPVQKPVAKPKMEAEETQKPAKMKKKYVPLSLWSSKEDMPRYRGRPHNHVQSAAVGGSQRQGYNFSEQEERPRYRGRPRKQVQSVKQNDVVPSFDLESGGNFPDLHSASGA